MLSKIMFQEDKSGGSMRGKNENRKDKEQVTTKYFTPESRKTTEDPN